MNVSDVYVFKKVARTLSFSGAARQLGISRSAVSKQVRRLEQDLGVVLINRTTRSVNLTESGRTFHSNTCEIDTTLEQAANLVRNTDLSPRGTISFALPSGLGLSLMPTVTAHFQKLWPDVHLNIHFDDCGQNMITENLELAIRISQRLPDSSLIARRLASTKKVLAASPHYLAEMGVPRNIRDLSDHRCLGIGSAVKTGETWHFKENGKCCQVSTTFALSSNNNLVLIIAASLNAGIICVPEICIADELARRQLQIIDCCQDPEPYGIFAVYPHRNSATKVKVLVDFIERKLDELSSIGDRTSILNPVNHALTTVSSGSQLIVNKETPQKLVSSFNCG